MNDDQACEVPFVEQLRSIPKDYRTCRAIQWSEDGRETGHQLIPVGFMMHRAADEIERLKAAASQSEAVDEGCICKGNWRAIVKEYAPMIGKTFKRGDKTYRFFGLVHGDDDYYYGLVEVGGKVVLSSCVGSLEMNGLEETDSPSAPEEKDDAKS